MGGGRRRTATAGPICVPRWGCCPRRRPPTGPRAARRSGDRKVISRLPRRRCAWTRCVAAPPASVGCCPHRPVVAARTASGRATTDAGRTGSHPEGRAAGIAEGVLPRELCSRPDPPAAWQPPFAGSDAPSPWGPYAGAVTRWERLLGRPAPAPTQPGTHGRPVLAPPFVEWLMGLSIGSELEAGQHGKPFLQAKAGRSAWLWCPTHVGHLGLWPRPAVGARDHGAGLGQGADLGFHRTPFAGVIPARPTTSDASRGCPFGNPQRTVWKTW